MNRYGIEKRIEALNHKFGIGLEPITRVERPVLKPAPRIEGEPYQPNPIPTGQIIIREVNV